MEILSKLMVFGLNLKSQVYNFRDETVITTLARRPNKNKWKKCNERLRENYQQV